MTDPLGLLSTKRHLLGLGGDDGAKDEGEKMNLGDVDQTNPNYTGAVMATLIGVVAANADVLAYWAGQAHEEVSVTIRRWMSATEAVTGTELPTGFEDELVRAAKHPGDFQDYVEETKRIIGSQPDNGQTDIAPDQAKEDASLMPQFLRHVEFTHGICNCGWRTSCPTPSWRWICSAGRNSSSWTSWWRRGTSR